MARRHGRIHAGPIEHSFDIGVEYSNEQTHNQNYAVNGPGLPATFGFPFVATSGVLNNTFPAGPNCTNPGALGPPSPAQWNCTSLDNPNQNDAWVGTAPETLKALTCDPDSLIEIVATALLTGVLVGFL